MCIHEDGLINNFFFKYMYIFKSRIERKTRSCYMIILKCAGAGHKGFSQVRCFGNGFSSCFHLRFGIPRYVSCAFASSFTFRD